MKINLPDDRPSNDPSSPGIGIGFCITPREFSPSSTCALASLDPRCHELLSSLNPPSTFWRRYPSITSHPTSVGYVFTPLG